MRSIALMLFALSLVAAEPEEVDSFPMSTGWYGTIDVKVLSWKDPQTQREFLIFYSFKKETGIVVTVVPRHAEIVPATLEHATPAKGQR